MDYTIDTLRAFCSNSTDPREWHGGYVFTLRPGDTVFTLSKAPDLGSAFPLVSP